MISKIRHYQDSWVVKGILVLTALSFMSLFGISGYISRSGANRPIIRVDDLVITQDEINFQLNDKLQKLRSLLDDDAEISEAMRTAILQEIVQTNLINTIMQKTATKNSVNISDDLVRKIVYSQPEFMNADGQFDIEKMRSLLRLNGSSEAQYVEALRRDIIKQHLLYSPVEGINIPQVMMPYLTELSEQQKIFEYVVIEPAKIMVDRKMSEEEVEQYYQDFASQFQEAESRNISFVEFSVDELAKRITPSDEEISAYYQDNIEQFVIPENREVLQMVFDTQDDANKAWAALNAGGDFLKVAKDMAKQENTDTKLGNVSQDMLLEAISEDVFTLKKGEYTSPLQSDMGWHIMKVTAITPKKETSLAAAKEGIIAEIRKDLAYEQASDVMAEIEDKLGAGATLEDIATAYNVKINKVSDIKEDGTFAKANKDHQSLVSSVDFIETAFSYNMGEISQVVETDSGFAILQVDNINEAKTKDLAKVRGEIQKMWADNEKSAIAQEIVNDVTHDLENGDDFADVARRFSLNYRKTSPLKKGEIFAGLTSTQAEELYQEKIGTPKIFAGDEKIVIAMPKQIIRNHKKLSAEQEKSIKTKATQNLSQELVNELTDAYGSNYKVRVKYKYLGLSD